MKQIYLFCLTLLMALGVSLNAKADPYTLHLEWETPGSIRIASGSAENWVDIPAGATSLDVDCEFSWDPIYVYSTDGYIITGGTFDGNEIEVQNLYNRDCLRLTNNYVGKTVYVNCSAPKRDGTIDINVVNGLTTLTVTSHTGETFDLKQGINEIPFNPDADNPLTVAIAGRLNAYNIALNGQSYEYDADNDTHTPDGIVKWSTMTAEYQVTMAAGDELKIQPLEDGAQELESCTLTIEYGDNMKGCITNIMNHATSHMLLPEDYEDDVIDNIVEGTELVLNFCSEDHTVTKVTLNGVNIPITNEGDNINQQATITVTDVNSVLEIEGNATVWADYTYTGYISDPEGVLFGNTMSSDPSEYDLTYNEIGDVGGQTYGVLTMPEGSKEITLEVSQKNNHGKGSFYFMPKPGYFITKCYFGLPNDSETKGTLSINSALNYEESSSFYIIVDKLDPSYTANLKVVDTGYHETTTIKSSSTYADKNGNQDQQKIELQTGDSEITFSANFDNPFTLYLNESQTMSGVYLDGAEVTGSKNGDTNQTEYELDLYAPAAGETSDLHSDVQVYFTGKPSMATASLDLQNNASAEFFYSPFMHPANEAGQAVIAGTVMTVKPTSPKAVVIYKGEVQKLDNEGQFQFTTSTTTADNVVTVTLPKSINIAGIVPSNGSKVKTLRSFAIRVPGKADESEIIMEPDATVLAGLTVTDASNNTVATFDAIGEGSMSDDEIICPIILNTTITEEGTYYINIPEGAFVEMNDDQPVPGGYVTARFSGRLKVDPTAKTALDTYTFTPAEGSVESIETISIAFTQIPRSTYFENAEFANATFKNGDATISGAIAYDMSSEEDCLVIKITPINGDDEATPITQDGKWIMTIPAGTFTLDGNNSEEITATFTVEGSAIAYTLTPADETTLPELTYILVAFPEASSAKFAETANIEDVTLAAEDGDWTAELTQKESTSETPAFKFSITNPTLEKGTYKLSIPAGYFLIDGTKESAAIEATYMIDLESGVAEIISGSIENASIFTIDGRLLVKKADKNALDSLEKGIYIINGKKVIKK